MGALDRSLAPLPAALSLLIHWNHLSHAPAVSAARRSVLAWSLLCELRTNHNHRLQCGSCSFQGNRNAGAKRRDFGRQLDHSPDRHIIEHMNECGDWGTATWRYWQTIRNQEPARPSFQNRPPVAVRVRVAWENDGEEWVDATATRRGFDGAIYVEIRDRRCSTLGAWFRPGDVRLTQR